MLCHASFPPYRTLFCFDDIRGEEEKEEVGLGLPF